MAPKTYGHARRGLVPHIPATTARVCGKCDSWYAARSRETVCDGCVPASVRTQRALKMPPPAHQTRPLSRAGERAGKRGVGDAFRHVYSEALGLNFRCPVKDPRAASLECRVLAYEEAARQRWKYGKVPESPETIAEAAV